MGTSLSDAQKNQTSQNQSTFKVSENKDREEEITSINIPERVKWRADERVNVDLIFVESHFASAHHIDKHVDGIFLANFQDNAAALEDALRYHSGSIRQRTKALLPNCRVAVRRDGCQ